MNQTKRMALTFAAATMLVAGPLLSAAPVSASAAPGPELEFNASGKTTPDGRPLLPTPQALVGGRGGSPATAFSANADSPTTTTRPECPPQLAHKCHFVPASYQQVDPNDKSNYGSYDLAKRDTEGPKINTIVIHDTEGTLESAIAHFQDPSQYVSAHYIIDSDGSIYQMVQTKNVAWHAGNWYTNEHSIGIEHVGHAINGHTEYTAAMYQSSAALVRYLATKYPIPLDRQHIIGHDNVQAPIAALVAGMHYDPGPFWNWQRYNALLGITIPAASPGSPLLTISPLWSLNRPTVTDCSTTPCTTLPAQPANFLYLRAAPSDSAPLLSDPALHPDGSPGSTRIEDWSAKAVYGQQFAVADRQDDWVAIWYGGQKGWFRNPGGLLSALPARGQFVTPRPGLTSIPVYGRAYPEAGAYAGRQVPVQSVVPLQYTIGAGQKYATTGLVPTDYYWTWYIDASFNPDDHTTVIGQDRYLQIQFNGRVAFIKEADVIVHH